MKFSINILFLLTILAAIEVALFRRQLQWPILASVGIGLLLLWAQWQSLLTKSAKSQLLENQQEQDAGSTSVGPASVVSNKVFLCVIALCFGAAIFSILTSTTDVNEDPRIVSAQSVLILATILLSSSLEHMPARSIKYRAAVAALISLAMVVILTLTVNPALWYVYMACRGMQNAMLDPHHILGMSRVLLFGAAAIKAAVGILGWCTWLLVAVFLHRRVQRSSNGVFVAVWIACGMGCLATYLQWQVMLDDFPEMRLPLSVLLQETYNFDLALFLILGVTGFLQYCMIDRNTTQSVACAGQVLRNRILGMAMMLPIVLLFGIRVFSLGKLIIGWWDWDILASELFNNESLMLVALLALGVRVVANAQCGSAKFHSLSVASLFQLILVGYILIVFLPLHFVALQFYIDAVVMLSPKF